MFLFYPPPTVSPTPAHLLLLRAHLGLLALRAGLVAELYECHQHGQNEADDQDVEDARHMAQTKLTLACSFLLLLALRSVVPPPSRKY